MHKMSLASKFLGLLFITSLSHGLPVTNEKVTSSLSVTDNSTLVQADDVAATTVSYSLYTGSGQQWPAANQWVTFEQM